jgi:hypothetical protein
MMNSKSEEAKNRLCTSKGGPVAVWSSKVCKLGEKNKDLCKQLATGMSWMRRGIGTGRSRGAWGGCQHACHKVEAEGGGTGIVEG